MKKLEFGLDYLEFTIYTDKWQLLEIYNLIFMDYLGELDYKGGTKHYEGGYINGAGFYLLTDPRNKRQRYHGRYILPGSICQALPFEIYAKFIDEIIKRGIQIKITRLDIRIDNCNFKPLQAAKSIEQGKAKTRAHRDTLKTFSQPLEKDDLGNLGTEGMYLGSRTSEKLIRIYNKHGFTRLELQANGDAATAYFYLLYKDQADFIELAFGIILDFIDIDEDYWREFKTDYERAYMITHEYTDPTLDKLKKYLIETAAIPLGIIFEIEGEKFIRELAKTGLEKAKTKAKYYPLLHAYGISLDD